MFERKDNKKEALLDLDGRLVTLNRRYTAVKDAGLRIHAMVAVRNCPERLLAFSGGKGRGRAGDSFKSTSVVAHSTLFNPRVLLK